MVNINMLKFKIIEKGWNVEKIAKKIGIDRSTFYRKMNDTGSEFTIREADYIARLLDLNYDEVNEIFLAILSHISNERKSRFDILIYCIKIILSRGTMNYYGH